MFLYIIKVDIFNNNNRYHSQIVKYFPILESHI